jgi:ABC-2 type transport system ATP-binding protein
MNEIINVRNLEKSYKGSKVIKDISFEVMRGEILCFLGPNGAGKSTMINILTGALGYETGDISYKNRKLRKEDRDFKQQLGIVP